MIDNFTIKELVILCCFLQMLLNFFVICHLLGVKSRVKKILDESELVRYLKKLKEGA